MGQDLLRWLTRHDGSVGFAKVMRECARAKGASNWHRTWDMERLRSPRLKLPVECDLWFEPRLLSQVRGG